ncbi:hypothetical protein RRG08_023403 [Elysia crispata]|uniref:Uncharacterized protein n=1 Tax=Elysia crispata TaxID=231223 RepID=A0AAE0YFQ4_9GAST|nr:hypothetical protein RRG08_023403 [Elysia crispata]
MATLAQASQADGEKKKVGISPSVLTQASQADGEKKKNRSDTTLFLPIEVIAGTEVRLGQFCILTRCTFGQPWAVKGLMGEEGGGWEGGTRGLLRIPLMRRKTPFREPIFPPLSFLRNLQDHYETLTPVLVKYSNYLHLNLLLSSPCPRPILPFSCPR